MRLHIFKASAPRMRGSRDTALQVLGEVYVSPAHAGVQAGACC